MTLGDLRKIIDATPAEFDDVPVLSPASDHSYIPAKVIAIADVEKQGAKYWEYFGYEHLTPGGKKIKAFVID